MGYKLSHLVLVKFIFVSCSLRSTIHSEFIDKWFRHGLVPSPLSEKPCRFMTSCWTEAANSNWYWRSFTKSPPASCLISYILILFSGFSNACKTSFMVASKTQVTQQQIFTHLASSLCNPMPMQVLEYKWSKKHGW